MIEARLSPGAISAPRSRLPVNAVPQTTSEPSPVPRPLREKHWHGKSRHCPTAQLRAAAPSPLCKSTPGKPRPPPCKSYACLHIHSNSVAQPMESDVTAAESKKLVKGNRVCWRRDADDSGTIIGTSWNAVTIAWDNGQVNTVHHGDMREIHSASAKPKSV